MANTGWGVIDNNGGRFHYLASGVIKTGADEMHIARLDSIRRELTAVVAHWQPRIACVERVFANVNAKSSMALGEARGTAIGALLECRLEVMEFSALQIKKSVTGMGRADKKQVSEMVARLLSMPETAWSSHAADALACALSLLPLTQLHSSRLPAYRGRRRARR